MKRHFTHIILFIALCCSACEDVVDIEVTAGEQLLVVEGWVTDHGQPQEVKLSYSQPYFDNSEPEPITNATVSIEDYQDGALLNSYPLEEQVAGTYSTDAFQGEVGHEYRLAFNIESQAYEAWTALQRTMPVEALEVFYREGRGFDAEGYYLLLYTTEPEGTGDYYLFRLYKNDTLFNRPQDISTQSDRFIDGQFINGVELNRGNPFQLGDSARFEIWSLSEESYRFYNNLREQVVIGGPYANPPANISSNVKAQNPDNAIEIVGHFGASAVSGASILIEEIEEDIN